MEGAQETLFPMTEIIGVAICLVFSAFFSGTETLLTKIPDTRALHLIESDAARYGLLQFWLDNKRRILAGLLVCNNLVNILASILGYRIALFLLPAYAELVSVAGVTLLVLVFGEITPKSIALQLSLDISVIALRIVWLLDKLVFLVAAPLSKIPRLIYRHPMALTSVPPVTEDEIEYHIRLAKQQQAFEEVEQGELLMSAMQFPDTQVKEIMVPRTDMCTLEADTSIEEAVAFVLEHGHSRVPIYKESIDGGIIGLLYSKDLLLYVGKSAATGGTIEALVRKPPFYVPATQKISGLLADIRKRSQHMAIVVDEFGGTAGLITLEDIIEELVGEIRDEFDSPEEEALVRRVDDKTWMVDARVSIYDLKDATGIELPDTGDYQSVGGFVVAKHGSIPEKHTAIDWDGVRLTVVSSDSRHVQRVEIKITRGDAPPDK